METFSALLALCAGNSPVTGEFPTQRPVTRSFDVFFDLGLNERLSKQPWGWWFETLSLPLWRHFNVCLPSPKKALPMAVPPEYPSCRQTTLASTSFQSSSHTVPHSSRWYTSTRPSFSVSPSANRTAIRNKNPWRSHDLANYRLHYALVVVFVCLHFTLPHYHHYADVSEGIELLKYLSGVFCPGCV